MTTTTPPMLMRVIFLAVLIAGSACVSIGANGCASKQVAEKTRTADDLVDGVQKSLKAIIEFDAEAKSEADALNHEINDAMNELSAAIQASKWPLVAEVHYKLIDIERRTALIVEQAKIRAKALSDAKDRADAAKAASSAAAALAEANAAQYQAFVGLGQAIVGGVTSHPLPSVPGYDYTGEVVTGITTLLLSFLGVQGGKHLMKRQTITLPPAPSYHQPVYPPRRGPLAPPNAAALPINGTAQNGSNGSNGAFPDNVDPALMAAWKASQEESGNR